MGSKVRFIKTFPCGMTGWLGRCKDSQGVTMLRKESVQLPRHLSTTIVWFPCHSRLQGDFTTRSKCFSVTNERNTEDNFFSSICYCLNLRLCKDSFQFNKGSCDICIYRRIVSFKMGNFSKSELTQMFVTVIKACKFPHSIYTF